VRDSCAATRHLTVGAADQPPPPRVAHAPHRPILIPSSYHAAAQSHFPSSPLASPLPLAATRAAITAVPRPPSTVAAGASPSPSTPPVASPELEVALHPHQSRQPMSADHLTGVPLRPTAHRRRATATVCLPLSFAPNRSHHRPGPLPGYFPADQRRRGGGGISLPCFLSWAETPRELGRLAEQAEALLWAEPKCTVHFLNFL
jgi:hypothetical protein